MADAKTDPAEDAKNTESEAKAAADAKAAEDAKADDEGQKVGDVLNNDEKKEPKMVPESALLEFKRQNKDLKDSLTKLQKQVDGEAPKSETRKTVAALKEKYPDSSDFIDEFYAAVKADIDSDVDERVSAKTKPLEAKENAKRIDEVFNEHFDKTLEALPEYKDVANRDVIKTLSLDPKNANKTFAQILKDAYGHLLTGKRTLEKTKPRGGKGNTGVDLDRAKKDPEYFKEIMADPDLKKEYNEGLAGRISSVL